MQILRRCESGDLRLPAEETAYVSTAVHNMDDLDSSAPLLVEDKPVFETFDRPASKAASRGLAEAAANADFGQITQGFEAPNEFIQKTLGDLKTGLLFEVIEFFLDLSPRDWTHEVMTH